MDGLPLVSFTALFPTIFILLATTFLTILKIWSRRPKTDTPLLPPGPRKLPILGNLHNLVSPTLPHRRLMELAIEHGPLVQLQLGETPTVVVSSPELAKEFLQTHDLNFATRPFLPSAATLLYNGRDILFAPLGSYWREMRKICVVELLSPKRVRSFRSIRAQEVNGLVSSISMLAGGEAINLGGMLFSLVYNVRCQTAFGLKAQNQEEGFLPVLQRIMKALGGISLWDLFPSSNLVRLFSGTERKLKKLHGEADVILERVISDHVARRRTNNANGAVVDDRDGDLVDVLLNLSTQKNHGLGFPITRLEIKAVILDMFLGGSDTSAVTVEWAMSELMKHPRVMKKVQKEVRQMFDGKSTIDEAYLDELHYFNMVIKETLRLHPPVPLLTPRECQETVEIDGYQISAKTRIIINAFAIGRDPRCWKEPTKFYPERFLDTSVDYNGQDFKFIPFGAGRRICPGLQSGTAVVKLLLANLLYHFDWKLPNGNDPQELDMSEDFGLTVKRKDRLFLIPILHHPQPANT